MSQHSQLAAGSGFVPADGQRGDVLAGPALFGPPARPRPERVATVGVEPSSFLRRAILWRAFGVANVEAVEPAGWSDTPVAAGAVVLHEVPDPPSWERLLEWAGERTVVVDVHVAIEMAARAGHPLRIAMVSGSPAPALAVMCQAENRAVYPNAPAVEIVAEPPVPAGLAVGDRVHLYTPSPTDLALRVVADDEALARFAARFGAVVWGREATTSGAALLSCPTRAGGLVTVMDLQAVDRAPEPSGSETPGIHLLLSLLGRVAATFGRFTVPHPRYSEFIEALRELTARYPRFAAIEPIGKSVEGRELWLLKIARKPKLPAVLLTNAIHPYEWAPIYGVLRYVRFLLERLEAGGFEAEELLGRHQLWWVPSACPDGFDDRRQQPSAINLNRNFPGGWEYAALGQLQWGSFGRPHTISELSPISLRGPAPASQPEVRALMGLFERQDGQIVTLADFHENTGPGNFLHQFEDERGVIADADYHVELLEGICQSFAGRFFEQRDRSFAAIEHAAEFRPGRVCAWLGYAVAHGAKGCVVEATGGDCTHYRTIRRTEYAAHVAEQVLAAELGRLYRNPGGEDRPVTLTPRRRPPAAACRLYDAAGSLLEETTEDSPAQITRIVPAGGCLRVQYEE
jgi:hypothetical protein